MKKLSFLCSGGLTVFLAFATTACSDNTDDRTNSATTASVPSGSTYSAPPATRTSSSVGNELDDESNDHIVDPDASDTGAKGN